MSVKITELEESVDSSFKKHISTVHCSNSFSLLERKLFNALLFQAYPDLLNSTKFSIQAKKLCQLIGYNSNDYESLKKALKRLMEIVVEWNVINDSSLKKDNKWQASTILAAVELENGLCSYEYSSIMRELLYRPEIYASLDIDVISSFKSIYGLTLYENCFRFQRLPQTPWFPESVFRKLMLGEESHKYPVFKDFKKRVLLIAVEEVNKHTSLIVTPEIKRNGRKVDSIRFLLEKKSQKTVLEKEDLNIKLGESELKDIILKSFGLSEKQTQSLFDKYDVSYIKEKVELILGSDSYRSGKILALGAYLNDALSKDYKNSCSSKTIVEKTRQLKKSQEIEKEQDDVKVRVREAEYNLYISTIIENYLLKLTILERNELVQDFEVTVKNNHIVWRNYKKYKLNSKMTSSLFQQFVRTEKILELGKILSYQEFQSQKEPVLI